MTHGLAYPTAEAAALRLHWREFGLKFVPLQKSPIFRILSRYFFTINAGDMACSPVLF
jgi:hypothetical protein